MSANPSELHIRTAKEIARKVAEGDAKRTAWRRVSTLRYLFDMEGLRFGRGDRERMQAALEGAGLTPDPSILDVERDGTVRLYPTKSRLSVRTERPAAPLPAPPASQDSERERSRRVFISYRHEDCQPQANGLYDGLRQRIPEAEIFMDLDTIPPGTDFEEYIRNWIENSDIVLILIGDNWLDKDERGERRLDHPDDFVRLEVRAALEQSKTLVPVLVEGASMPRSTDLPVDIARLARIQAIELSDRRWRADVGRLSDVVKTTTTAERRPKLAQPQRSQAAPTPQSVSGGPEPTTLVDFPSRFTDRWFSESVPGMNSDQLARLSEELARRGWSPGELIDRVYIYAARGVMPPPRPLPGDPRKASSFEVPSRIYPAWLARNVPNLDDNELAVVLEVLRRRGWTEGEIEDHVFSVRAG